MKVTVPYTISSQRVCDMVVTAFEGGISYWCANVRLVAHKAERSKAVPWYSEPGLYDLPFTLEVEESDPSGDDDDGIYFVTDKDFAKGFEVMAEKYPWHFNNFMNDNEDAETADVWFQCIVFGEIVYG